MKTRRFEESDYEILCSWWDNWDGWEAGKLPRELLPKTGVIAEHKREPVAMAFLYTTDSGFVWIAWPTGNPKADSDIRGVGVDLVIKELVKLAKARGAKTIITTTGHGKMEDRFQNLGFDLADLLVSQYTLNLETPGERKVS